MTDKSKAKIEVFLLAVLLRYPADTSRGVATMHFLPTAAVIVFNTVDLLSYTTQNQPI